MTWRTAMGSSGRTSRGRSWSSPATRPSSSASWWCSGPTSSSARPGATPSSSRA
uniref:Uncharacterized protein n=1 Tax=Anguilla anguilla TaxID=7936 RepID=A0A0E9VWB3_ANGAN